MQNVDRPARDQPAAPLEQGRPADRRAVRRPLRRRDSTCCKLAAAARNARAVERPIREDKGVTMGFAEYDRYDGSGLAHLVRRRKFRRSSSSTKRSRASSATIPTLNAVVYKAYDEARATAKGKLPDGPFKGVPFLIKDISMPVAGWPMTNGSAFLRNYVSTDDAELTQALSRFRRRAGRQDQHAGVRHSRHDRRPPPRHLPQSVESRSLAPAARRAARRRRWRSGMVPMAHGSDGLGSIRIPAAQCGLVGMKPTQYRNPGGPDDRGRAHGLVVDHVLTRTVRDSAAMLDWTGYAGRRRALCAAAESASLYGRNPDGARQAAHRVLHRGAAAASPPHPDVQSGVRRHREAARRTRPHA